MEIEWSVFVGIIVGGTGSLLVFFGIGIGIEVVKAYRERRIQTITRRLKP